MPGLIRGVARTAVVAGTATAVSNRVSRRQQGRWAEQSPPEQPAPSQEAPPTTQPQDSRASDLARLKELGELKESGVLTDAEFEEQKRKILSA